MKSRKPLSLLLTAALLMTTLLSAVWLPLSAEDNSTRIPADAPAIRADVGDVIDLSSYTVELPDGSVVSGKDLTWYNKGAEKTVKSATPVIYTDAGKTVAQLLGEVEVKTTRTLVLEPGAYPPALVLANFKDKDVDTLLDLMKQAQVNIPLKAVVTPTSKSWVFGDLLAHLQEEHTAFTAAKETAKA